MSGGTWYYRNEMAAQFLTEDIQDLQESSFYTDFPRLAEVLFELGSALDEITHDLDWHYACDSQIEDMEKFEREALEKLREAANEPSYAKMLELCEAYRKAICDQAEKIEHHGIERDYWRREFYRLRSHCERVTGTSPVDIGPQDD